MIITKLLGGLGNQMFQYAAGYSLAKRNGMPLKLDISALKKYSRHAGYQFEEIFSGHFEIADTFDLIRSLGLSGWKLRHQGIDVAAHKPFKKSTRIAQQKTHNYWPELFSYSKNNTYISGYWQSSKYFRGFENELRQIFEIKTTLKGRNKEIAEKIHSEYSVSVHLRRGDYISNQNANKFHGVCSLDYYKSAIELMSNRYPNAKYYIFSDDIEFAKAEFQNDSKYTIVDGNNGVKSYLDMHLMSLCNSHIIANSTFSWWGAWLSQGEMKFVIAPKTWFAGSEDPIKDIYEDTWLQM